MSDDRFNIKTEDGKPFIYDIVRKKYVSLTAEEWVRQNILFHLVHVLKYPLPLISVEKQIKVGNRNRRYDIVVYKSSIPWLMIECKREEEVLNHHVLSQLLAYHSTLQVSFLTITNGNHIMTYDVSKQEWQNQLPSYD